MVNAAAMRDLAAAESYVHTHIPLTRVMGLRIVPDDASTFAIEAPVAMNYNHLRTAFGGSISAVALLAGYCFLWLQSETGRSHIVIRESRMKFVRPVRHVIRARVIAPPADALERFNDDVAKTGRAELQLRVVVEEEGQLAAELSGSFVARAEK